MSIVRIDRWHRDGRLKQGVDSYFVYTAYAPMSETEVLVKVGISTVPYQRLVSIYCNTPFPIEFAAFSAVGRKRRALRAEAAILGHFVQFKTRGEWLRLPSDQATRKRFADLSRTVLEQQTGKPVAWQRVTAKQLRAYMSGRMKEKMASY